MKLDIQKVIAVAEKASESILTWYEKPSVPTKAKADNSPLTHADEDANRIIISGLKEISDWPIVTEESLVPYETRKTWQTFWIVDPLDGTRNFLAKDGQFTINIALIENYRPIAAVVLAPALNLTYSALKNDGAYLNGTRINYSKTRTDLIAGVSSMHGSNETTAFLNKLGITKISPTGSSLKLCKIAEGEIDIYPRLGTTCEWDIAAGHLVLTEGGGKIVDLETRAEPLYNKQSLENNHFVAAYKDFDFSVLWKN